MNSTAALDYSDPVAVANDQYADAVARMAAERRRAGDSMRDALDYALGLIDPDTFPACSVDRDAPATDTERYALVQRVRLYAAERSPARGVFRPVGTR